MSSLGVDLDRKRSLFFIFLSVNSVAVVSYAAAFLLLDARLTALWMLLGVTALTPLALLSEIKGYRTAARLILIAEALNSIFAVRLGVRASLNIELYYLTSMAANPRVQHLLGAA